MTSSFNADIEDTGPTLAGPWRGPHQMLASQEYDGHASIHDLTPEDVIVPPGFTRRLGVPD